MRVKTQVEAGGDGRVDGAQGFKSDELPLELLLSLDAFSDINQGPNDGRTSGVSPAPTQGLEVQHGAVLADRSEGIAYCIHFPLDAATDVLHHARPIIGMD